MSSTCVATPGSSVEIHRPDSPHRLNSQNEGNTRFGAAENVASSPVVLSATGICLPAYFSKAGLYSKVSIWLTPPSMNSKMQLFALQGWCVGLGDIGVMGSPDAQAE